MQASFNLPKFNAFALDEYKDQFEQLLKESREALEQLTSSSASDWDSLIYPLDVLENRISSEFSPLRHLNSVMSSDQTRDVYNACLPGLSSYNTDFGQNTELYNKVLALSQSEKFKSLSAAQKKCIDDLLLSFRLGGVALTGKERTRFKDISLRLSELTTLFQDNLLDATRSWRMHLENADRLQGMEEHSLALARQESEREGRDGYTLTLEVPSYLAVMTFVDDRELRQTVYRAYMTRASSLADHDESLDNAPLIEEIINLRSEMARLLGFSSYADYSVASKMVDSPEQVENFLLELTEAARPVALKEYQQLCEFASRTDNIDKLQSWDVAYYSNKLKKELFDFSEQELKPYFPADRVVNGLFEVTSRLFNVNINRVDNADVWHEDVTLYEISDSADEVIGAFYFDNYARSSKRGGAWMDVCRSRMLMNDSLQLPVAYLTCNLTPPVGDEPALLTHNEVTTLFHEFGHGLHHMLTRVDHLQISGISGVEWDAVELPSQFLENWCWERESLDMISGHYQTGDKIPPELLEKARAARNYQAAMMTVRQIEFALFDMRLHQCNDNPDRDQIQQLLDQIRKEVAVVEPPEFVKFQNGFAHIFAGGYAAGYFSYKWAEVLSCDAYSRFEEAGIFDRSTGEQFKQCILERGGSKKAMELFVDFMGRKPTIDALLRQHGLAA